jgi:hypothetical protein
VNPSKGISMPMTKCFHVCAFCGIIINSRKQKHHLMLCFSSASGMLGITFHQNPFSIHLKSAVSNFKNGTHNDVLWVQAYEKKFVYK